jgi:hypothetical protein
VSDNHKTCANCRHYFPWESAGKKLAHCRLNGPTISPRDGSTVWPMVLPSFTCGQFSESPKARPERVKSSRCAEHCVCPTCLITHPARWKTLGSARRDDLRRAYPDLAAKLDRLCGEGYEH